MCQFQTTLLLLSVNVINVLAAPKTPVTSQRPMGLLVQHDHVSPPTTTTMQQSTPTTSCFRTDGSGSVWAYPTETYNHFDQAFCAGPSTAVPAATPLPEESSKEDDAEFLERWKPNWCNHFPFMDDMYNPWSLWALLVEYDADSADTFADQGAALREAVMRNCKGGVEEWMMRPSADYNSTMELNFSTREVCESGVSEALREVSNGSLSVTCLGWHEFMQSRPVGVEK